MKVINWFFRGLRGVIANILLIMISLLVCITLLGTVLICVPAFFLFVLVLLAFNSVIIWFRTGPSMTEQFAKELTDAIEGK